MTEVLSAQQVFETVARHLFAQGERAVNDTGGCVYRAPNGNKCAMGILIPDEDYEPSMEGSTVYGLINGVLTPWGDGRGAPAKAITDNKTIMNNKDLITDLQDDHDCIHNWTDSNRLTNALIETGAKHNLSVAFLDSLYFGMAK